jgi:uncharacterized protein (UPF0264 family)
MTKLLVSVRSVDEALVVVEGGADFIDLKEPGQGALGGLPITTIVAIITALRERHIALPVSATIGDVPNDALDEIAARVEAVGACGVDYVKVGIDASAHANAVLERLAACGRPIVPVFIADRGLDPGLVARAVRLGFPGLMADTADKNAGSLFELQRFDTLRDFVALARSGGAMVGLAGALRIGDAPRLGALAPDFAGFRSAVCAGDRSASLDPERLRALVAALRAVSPAQASVGRTSPISSERIQASSLL